MFLFGYLSTNYPKEIDLSNNEKSFIQQLAYSTKNEVIIEHPNSYSLGLKSDTNQTLLIALTNKIKKNIGSELTKDFCSEDTNYMKKYSLYLANNVYTIISYKERYKYISILFITAIEKDSGLGNVICCKNYVYSIDRRIKIIKFKQLLNEH